MSGINTGLLYQAQPLSAAEFDTLERRVIEDKEAFICLDEKSKISFVGPFNPEVIKELAWHNAYEVLMDNNTFTKKVYEKTGSTTFALTNILFKPSIDVSWLPQDYQRVNYLENSGTQFINLGIKPDNNTSVDLKYESLQTQGNSQYIFGARLNSNATINYALNGSSSNNFWSARFTNTNALNSTLTRDTHIISSKITLNNWSGEWRLTDLNTGTVETKTLQNITVSGDADLYMFAFNTTNIHAKLRIYSCKIYKGANLITDLIPCYRKADGTAGMFDAVTGHFYTNNGSGKFTYN